MEPHDRPWPDRIAAGQELGRAVDAVLTEAPRPPSRTSAEGSPPSRPLVLALPRGGVPVAAEVASVLHGDLDVLVVRKAGVPWHRELALGAVTASGIRSTNDDVVAGVQLSRDEVEAAFATAETEARQRDRGLRGSRPPLDVRGRTVVLVDDGLATGATALAAAVTLTRARPAPARVLLAVPVAPPDTVQRLARHVEVVTLRAPATFMAVGEWFMDFSQVDDDQVSQTLSRHWGR